MANTIREVVAVFHDERSLQEAVDELLRNGFDRAACSLLAGRHSVEKHLGRYFKRVSEVEDDPEVPYIPYIGSDSRTVAMGAVASGIAYIGAVTSIGVIIASGGTAAAALAGAAIVGGAGGIIGAALSTVIGRHHEKYIKDQLERGGLLLWVRTENPAREKLACEILRRDAGGHVHGHDIPAHDLPRGGGESYALSFMNRLGL